MMSILAKLTKEDESALDMYLNQCLYAMRCNVNDSSGRSSFSMLYGRLPTINMENILTQRPIDYSDEYHRSALQTMHHAFIETAKYMRKAMKDRNSHFNKNLKEVELDVGHHVMLKNFTPTSKLSMKWLQNYVIKKKMGTTHSSLEM